MQCTHISIHSIQPSLSIGRHDYSNHYTAATRSASAQRFQLGQMYNYALCLFTFREIDCRLKATQRRLKLMICIIGFGRFLFFLTFFLSRNTHRGSFCLCSYVGCFRTSLILVRQMNLHIRKCYRYTLLHACNLRKNLFFLQMFRMTNIKHVFEKRPWGLSVDTKVTLQCICIPIHYRLRTTMQSVFICWWQYGIVREKLHK